VRRAKQIRYETSERRLPRRSVLASLHDPLGPDGPIGPQRRGHGIGPVADFTGVGAGVVAAIEDDLEIERHRRVAGQEGDGNGRQAILEADRVDEERVDLVEGAYRDVIIERTASIAGHFERDGRGVLAATKEIDLNQMNPAS
jgi:hypothetical protein